MNSKKDFVIIYFFGIVHIEWCQLKTYMEKKRQEKEETKLMDLH